MKRILSIFFLSLFLISHSGIAVSMHWCGGKITKVEFFSAHKHDCPCGKKTMKKGCCHDQSATLKVNQDLAKLNPVSCKIQAPVQTCVAVSPVVFSVQPVRPFEYNNRVPDPYDKIPIHLRNGVFLI